MIMIAAPGLLSRIQSTLLASSHLLHSLDKLLLDNSSLCQAVLSLGGRVVVADALALWTALLTCITPPQAPAKSLHFST